MKITHRKITSATNTANVPAAPVVAPLESEDTEELEELDDINDFVTEDGLMVMYGKVEEAVKEEYESINWDTTEDSILCIAVPKDTDKVLEFTIPFADLKFDASQEDVDYIVKAMKDINEPDEETADKDEVMAEEPVKSSIDIDSIEPNYITEYKIELKDGTSLVGVIENITDTDVILDETSAFGDTMYIGRDEIKSIDYLEGEAD